MAHVSIDGRWLWVNDRLCSIVGYGREELLGNRSQEITFVEDLAPHMARIEEMLRGESSSYELEQRYVRNNGRRVWVHVSGSFIRDVSGKPEHFTWVIEERKRLERKLVQRASLLDQAYDAIFARSLEGMILYWNKGARKRSQRPHERTPERDGASDGTDRTATDRSAHSGAGNARGSHHRA